MTTVSTTSTCALCGTAVETGWVTCHACTIRPNLTARPRPAAAAAPPPVVVAVEPPFVAAPPMAAPPVAPPPVAVPVGATPIHTLAPHPVPAAPPVPPMAERTVFVPTPMAAPAPPPVAVRVPVPAAAPAPPPVAVAKPAPPATPATPRDAQPARWSHVNDVPATILLGPGEQVRFREDFSPRAILSHLKVTMVLTDRRIVVQRPNTLFGVVPHGFVEQTSPLTSVCEVDAGDHVSSRKLLIGTVLACAGVAFLFIAGAGTAVLGLVLLAAAAFQFLTCRSVGIIVRNVGAGTLVIPAGRGQRELSDLAKHAINTELYARR